jgi:hypothetical protein
MAMRATRLAVTNIDALGDMLSRLAPGQRGYITAEDYERLTAEELDEFSIEGRRIMGNLAVQHKCTIETPTIERRVYFTKLN